MVKASADVRAASAVTVKKASATTGSGPPGSGTALRAAPGSIDLKEEEIEADIVITGVPAARTAGTGIVIPITIDRGRADRETGRIAVVSGTARVSPVDSVTASADQSQDSASKTPTGLAMHLDSLDTTTTAPSAIANRLSPGVSPRQRKTRLAL